MDISLQGRDGMESAKSLRPEGFEDVIIFMSPTSEYAMDAWEIRAAHYLINPVGQKEIDTAMNRAIEKLGHIKFMH